MAILAQIPGVTVEIMVDRAPLQEYDDDSERDVTRGCTKYVESQTGKEFSMKATFAHPFHQRNVAFSVALDGMAPVKNIDLSEDDLWDDDGHKIGSITSRSGPYMYRQKFCFEKLETGEHIRYVRETYNQQN